MDSLERHILLFSLLLNECSQLAKLLLKSGPSTQNNDLEEQVTRQQLSLHNTRLSVTKTDLEYLTQAEAEQIIAQFESIPDNVDKLLFWTGLPRDWVQKWAEKHEMTTLTSAMGPLMDLADARCPRLQMARSRTGYLDWSRYVKGASGIFSRYACTCGIIRVLTLPPAESWRLRTNSTYYTIEEPVLRGSKGHCRAFQINFVHLLADSEALEYQVWPEDHTWEGLQLYTTDALIFMLPPPRPGSICSNNSGKTKRRKYKLGRTCQTWKDKVPSESVQASVTRNQTKNLNRNFQGSSRSASNEVERPKTATNVKRIKFRIEDTELRKISNPRQPNLVVSIAALDGKKRNRRHTSARSQSKAGDQDPSISSSRDPVESDRIKNPESKMKPKKRTRDGTEMEKEKEDKKDNDAENKARKKKKKKKKRKKKKKKKKKDEEKDEEKHNGAITEQIP